MPLYHARSCVYALVWMWSKSRRDITIQFPIYTPRHPIPPHATRTHRHFQSVLTSARRGSQRGRMKNSHRAIFFSFSLLSPKSNVIRLLWDVCKGYSFFMWHIISIRLKDVRAMVERERCVAVKRLMMLMRSLNYYCHFLNFNAKREKWKVGERASPFGPYGREP